MNQQEFMMLPEIEDIAYIERVGIYGFLFLYGQQMIAQKNNKQIGQEISYYKLNKYMRGNRVIVELLPQYDTLDNKNKEI